MAKKNTTYLIFFITLFYSGLMQARIVPLENYDYPIKSAYIATATVTALPICDLDFEKIKVKLIRNDEKDLSYKFYLSRSKAPSEKALIIFAGLGSNENDEVAQMYACLANRNGYHAIVAPNSFTRDYARNSSSSGVPGHPYVDAAELLNYLSLLFQTDSWERLKVKELKSLGYSHGALVNMHILALMKQSRMSHFQSSLLINPPVDLLYSVDQLDEGVETTNLNIIKAIKFLIRSDSWKKFFGKDLKFRNFYENYQSEIRIDEKAAKGLISAVFKASIPPVVDEILKKHPHPDFKPLPPPSVRYYTQARNHRRIQIEKLSYSDYIELFVKRFVAPNRNTSTQDLNNESSLFRYEQQLIDSDKIRVMTNANDFLLHPATDVAWLNKTLNNKIIIYPTGGHLGNIIYKDNLLNFKSWINNSSFLHERAAPSIY